MGEAMADVGVRAARGEDAAAMARVQVQAWRTAYAGVLPQQALNELTSDEAEQQWRERWYQAITDPPGNRHRVLVAVEVDTVVGLAAHAPAGDEDRDPANESELLALHVDPAHTRTGHGSRLLNATVDYLRGDGTGAAVTWVFEGDTALRAFLDSAGWAPDGARRDLDMGEAVTQTRLHCAIAPKEPDGPQATAGSGDSGHGE